MASGVRYPLQLSSVSENHAALYEESLQHPEQFWGDLARRRLRWTKEFDQVMDCDMNTGQFKWFIGGVLNVSGERGCSRYSLLRRHLTFQLTWSATLSLRIVEYYCRCTMSLGLFSKLHNGVGVVSLYIHV